MLNYGVALPDRIHGVILTGSKIERDRDRRGGSSRNHNLTDLPLEEIT
jgi:hypothetical protein